MKKLLLACAALGLAGLAWALDDDVAKWIKDLGSADPAAREAATAHLEQAGERARTALEAASKSDDPEVAWQADRLLKRLKEGPRDEPPKGEAPKPQRRGPAVRMSSTRVILNRNGETTTIQEDAGGRILVKETTKDGQSQEFKADSRADFAEKYPEVAKKYGLDKEPDESLDPRAADVEKEIERLRREMDEMLRRRRTSPDDLEKELEKALRDRDDPLRDRLGRVALGIRTAPVDDALRYQLDLPEGGLLVKEVLPGTRAGKLGLRQYDILLTLNGKPVSADADIRAALQAAGPATAEVVREGERQVLREKD